MSEQRGPKRPERFMRRALALAERGAGRVSPNPLVGAVLVKSGRVIGEGFHGRFGGAHAEIEAVRAATDNVRGATLYVTMEPCCFHGRTGACTEALTAAGIRRVIAAIRDPDPRVNGRGLRCLRAAGIEVAVGLLGTEARRLNEAYFHSHRRARPFFTLRAALSLDGMMAARDGESQWITGPLARRRAMEYRCRADAVLVGVETVRLDNPRLDCRGLRRPPILRAILDSDLRTPPTARLLQLPGPVLVFTGSGNPARRKRLERAGAGVVRVRRQANGLLDWNEVAAELHRGCIRSVLVEGGARVASSALEAGIIDKLVMFHAPVLIGPGRCVSAGLRIRRFSGRLRLTRVRHELLGPDVMTEGYPERGEGVRSECRTGRGTEGSDDRKGRS